MIQKTKIFIIDTSVFLSGKPIDLGDSQMVTTPAISDEISPGGKDYRNFILLQEKGLIIRAPSDESIDKINKTADKTGDQKRLSKADKEILALSLDLNKQDNDDVIILTDDYSIQNIAYELKIKFEGFAKKKITKKFKWIYRCPGCKRQFKDALKICPICGKETRAAFYDKKEIDKT